MNQEKWADTYVTTNGTTTYEFSDPNHSGFVGVKVNGEFWGSPQGNRFFKTLLRDIRRLEEAVHRYEHVIGSIANIDAAFMDGRGDAENYTDAAALDKIEAMVRPIWNELCERERTKGKGVIENHPFPGAESEGAK